MSKLVDDAETAIRLFGDNLDRHQAAILLSMWARRPEFTDADIAAVLERFPEPPTEQVSDLPDGVEGRAIGRARVSGQPPRVCDHCGATVPIVGGRYINHHRPQGDWCRDSGRPVPSPRIDR